MSPQRTQERGVEATYRNHHLSPPKLSENSPTRLKEKRKSRTEMRIVEDRNEEFDDGFNRSVTSDKANINNSRNFLNLKSTVPIAEEGKDNM